LRGWGRIGSWWPRLSIQASYKWFPVWSIDKVSIAFHSSGILLILSRKISERPENPDTIQDLVISSLSSSVSLSSCFSERPENPLSFRGFSFPKGSGIRTNAYSSKTFSCDSLLSGSKSLQRNRVMIFDLVIAQR
jgi:hypothetical protein